MLPLYHFHVSCRHGSGRPRSWYPPTILRRHIGPTHLGCPGECAIEVDSLTFECRHPEALSRETVSAVVVAPTPRGTLNPRRRDHRLNDASRRATGWG